MWEIASIIGFVGIAFILAYLSTRLSNEHIFLKIIFSISSLVMLILSLNFIRKIITEETTLRMVATAYFIVIMLVVIIFIYFMVRWITEQIKLKKEKELEGTR